VLNRYGLLKLQPTVPEPCSIRYPGGLAPTPLAGQSFRIYSLSIMTCIDILIVN